MRISDWSSDVCSSDLADRVAHPGIAAGLPPIGVVDLDEAFVAQHQRGLAAGAERQRVFDLRAQPQPDLIAIAAQPLLQPHPARQLAARDPADRETDLLPRSIPSLGAVAVRIARPTALARTKKRS